MRSPFVVAFFLCFALILQSCGGGGGDGEPAEIVTPSAPTGTVSGSLIVPPNHEVEVEPNDGIASAQPVNEVTKVSGTATSSDPGYEPPTLSGRLIQDLYLLEAADAVRIVLTIAADDPQANDLDLLLLSTEGELLDASEGLVANEDLTTDAPGNFLVGVAAVQGASAYLLSFEPLGSLAASVTDEASKPAFVPGEILVKMKPGVPEKTEKFRAAMSRRHGVEMRKSLPGGIDLMTLDLPRPGNDKDFLLQVSRKDLRQETLERIRQLRGEAGVAYAEPNYIRYPHQIPNDEFFDLQWNYPLIHLPQAWDVANGYEGRVIAVLDTGILPEHPDMAGKLIAGYDFISDASRANDGDGIDSDPVDAGDDPAKESSSFHGTHVAGIAGAATDNAEGVAGSTWTTDIMPLRVLGVEGGTVADIAQAIRYAAGLSNISETRPQNPADVINMSFGSPGFSQTVDDAVQAARAAGVAIVASAGNDNSSEPFYPASYSGVISVSAVDLNGQKAHYSNFGPQIDLAAPGGDTSRDLNGDNHPDGILSTHGDDSGGLFYRFLAGTSMAAPHVSGTIALMKAVYPQLTPNDVDLLITGQHPQTTIQIVRDIGLDGRDDLFGHGLIDAGLAIQAASDLAGTDGMEVPESILSLSSSVLDFQDYLTTTTFEVSNGGSGTLNILEVSENADWLTVDPTQGVTPLTVHLTVDRRGLAEGVYRTFLTVESDATEGDPTGTVEVIMTVGDVVLGNVGTTFVIAVDHQTLEAVAEAQTSIAQGYRFTIEGLESGNGYLIIAGTDRDGDGIICDIEDACGTYPGIVSVEGEEELNIEFPVSESSAPQSFSTPRPGVQ